jgi:hypothetical protein
MYLMIEVAHHKFTTNSYSLLSEFPRLRTSLIYAALHVYKDLNKVHMLLSRKIINTVDFRTALIKLTTLPLVCSGFGPVLEGHFICSSRAHPPMHHSIIHTQCALVF